MSKPVLIREINIGEILIQLCSECLTEGNAVKAEYAYLVSPDGKRMIDARCKEHRRLHEPKRESQSEP